MASSPALPPARHVPFKKGGWGAAIVTSLAAIGFFLGAFLIHQRTYREPTDVMMRQAGEPAAEHAPAAPAH